jgi:hypothetical protein
MGVMKWMEKVLAKFDEATKIWSADKTPTMAGSHPHFDDFEVELAQVEGHCWQSCHSRSMSSLAAGVGQGLARLWKQ